jgi:hypothetical protein
VRNRCHISNHVDANTQRGQSTNRGFTTRTRTFDFDVKILDTLLQWLRDPATSEATWAANGVDLREPLKPWPPDDAHDNALPWRSVMVMMVLLNEACTCATPSATFLRTFLRHALRCVIGGSFCHNDLSILYFFNDAAALRGPLRVRALVRVR